MTDNVTTYRISTRDILLFDRGVALTLPPCHTCPPEAMHTCKPGPSYRIAKMGDQLHVWCQAPCPTPHDTEFESAMYQPADVFVRTWEERDPWTYVIEVSDPNASHELRDLPPAWEYA